MFCAFLREGKRYVDVKLVKYFLLKVDIYISVPVKFVIRGVEYLTTNLFHFKTVHETIFCRRIMSKIIRTAWAIYETKFQREETAEDKSIYETLNSIQKLFQSHSPLYQFCRTILHKASYIPAMIPMKNSFMTRI